MQVGMDGPNHSITESAPVRTNAVIVGWGHTKFSKHDRLGLEDLIVAAAVEAMDDAQLSAHEVAAKTTAVYEI